MEYVWARFGNSSEYEKFDTMFDAGDQLGIFFSEKGLERLPPMQSVQDGTGVTIGPYFRGLNYVSLFWGDDDAQITRKHSSSDFAEFKRGFAEGAGIKTVSRSKTGYKVGNVKPKRRKQSTGGSLGTVR